MIVKHRKSNIYSSERKFIQGTGFSDNISNILQNVGSYVAQNRDMIAKPLLGAIGNLAATGLTEGSKALLNRITNKKVNKNKAQENPKLDHKALEILEQIITNQQTSTTANIIGSGIKRF